MSQVTTSWTPLDSGVMHNHQRAYELLGNDLMKIFAFVEPSEANKDCFGHEIYQLLLRVCTEFESVCKLAKIRLGHTDNPEKWNIKNYSKLNDLTVGRGVLSDYKFFFTELNSKIGIQPLKSFINSNIDDAPIKPEFYDAYNSVKHDRKKNFQRANLWSLLHAYAGLTAAMYWQGIETNLFGWVSPYGSINVKFDRFECAVQSGEPIYGRF
jgi:hypothetical protein